MLGHSKDRYGRCALAAAFLATPVSDRTGGHPRAFASWLCLGTFLLFSALAPAQPILEQKAKMRIDASEGLYVLVGETQAFPRTDHQADFRAVVSSLKKAYAVPLCVEYLDPAGTPGFPFVIDAGAPLSATITNLAERSGGTMVANAHRGRLVVTVAGATQSGASVMDRLVPQYEPGATFIDGLLALERSYNLGGAVPPMVASIACSGLSGNFPLQRKAAMGGGSFREAILELLEAAGMPDLTYGISVVTDATKRTHVAFRIRRPDCPEEFASADEREQFYEDMKAERARLDAYFAAGAESPKP